MQKCRATECYLNAVEVIHLFVIRCVKGISAAAAAPASLVISLSSNFDSLEKTNKQRKTQTFYGHLAVVVAPIKDATPEVPSHVPYLLIGAGTASFSAYRCSKELSFFRRPHAEKLRDGLTTPAPACPLARAKCLLI